MSTTRPATTRPELMPDVPGVDMLFTLARAFLPSLAPSRGVSIPPAVGSDNILEARIRKAETRYQTLVERIPVVTFMVSFEDRHNEIYVSPQIESLLGYTAREWVENPILWYERLYREDKARWNQDFARTVSMAEAFKGDYRFVAKNGAVVWIHGEATIERDEPTGKPSFLQGIGYDISEMKRAEAVLQRSREDLDSLVKARTTEILAVNQSLEKEIVERKNAETRQQELLKELGDINQELNQFAYVVSHDLKAPLRGISSLAEWLSTDYADKIDDAGQETIRLLLGRVRRMNALVDGILRYSRIGRIHEERSSVDLNALLRETCELLAPPASIVVRVAPDLPTVICERTRLIQIFENLISNAVKYMGKPSGEIDIGFEDDGAFWKFRVRDTGSGIEEKYFDKIFQIFQTLTPRDERESTGIGLAVVKKNVELFGGRIWVESKRGEGSTFFFLLPKSGTPPARAGIANVSA